MKIDKAKQLIVTILHKSLVGQLSLTSKFNPQAVADAIIDKVNFEKSYENIAHEKIIKDITRLKTDMLNELNTAPTSPQNQLLINNFIKGKLAAYDEMLESLNR